MILVLVGLSLRFGWRGTAAELRTSAVLLAVFLVPLFFTAGACDETRALGLLFPYLFLVGEEGAHALFVQAKARELDQPAEPRKTAAELGESRSLPSRRRYRLPTSLETKRVSAESP